MTAKPAVQTAGSFVLPADIERYDDKVTVTLPHGSLMFDTEFSKGWGYRSITVLSNDGDITVDGQSVAGLAEISRLYGSFAKAIHVHRSATNMATELHHNEVLPSHTDNPWLRHQWYRDNFLRWVELMPRPSATVPGAVAYYQNLDKRTRNILTPIKPGRFLKKFFGDILSEEQIHSAAMEWASRNEGIQVRITQDADEIQTIYQAHHFGSCMWFPSGDHEGHVHPARVYAGPDLAIAYIGTVDDPIARCVVYPQKKLYVSIYGDETRMEPLLREMGYRNGHGHEWHGARIQRIEYGRDRFILPYLDMTSGVDDLGDYLRLGGSIEYDSDNGVTLRDDRQTCDECNDRFDGDEITYISHLEIDVCDDCRSSNFFFCSGSDEYHRDEDRADTPTGAYSTDYVENSDEWFKCEGREKWYRHAHTENVTCASDLTYCLSYAQDNGYYCEYSQKWFVDEGWNARVELANGKEVNINEFGSKEEFETFVETEGTTMVCLPSDNQLELELPLQEAA
jgi:hypothetical protein